LAPDFGGERPASQCSRPLQQLKETAKLVFLTRAAKVRLLNPNQIKALQK
jgi:hypothetical protein